MATPEANETYLGETPSSGISETDVEKSEANVEKKRI
jgi:hypothetical protein